MGHLITDLDDSELRALLDASFGEGPAHRPLTDTLGAGRRAVRRRRTAVAGSALAAVLVVGGGALVVGDGPTRTVDRVPPATEAPGTTLTTTSGNVPRSELARITGVGSVEVRDGVEVADWRDDPLRVPDPGWSVGLDLRLDGETVWLMLSTDGTGLRGGPSQARSFDAWVTGSAAMQTSTAAAEDPSKTEDYRDLVELTPDGELVVLDEATLLDRIDGPGPGAVAVSVEYAGRVRWIAIQILPGDDGDTRSTSMRYADEVPQWTFDEFVAKTTGGRR